VIIALVWVFSRDSGTDSAPAPGASVSATATAEEPTTQEASPEPSDAPSSGFDEAGFSIVEGSLPPTAGEWQHQPLAGFDTYRKDGDDENFVAVSARGQDPAYADQLRPVMDAVQDVDGGFCGTVSGMPQCLVQPGKAPGHYYELLAVGEVPLDDLAEIAEGIANYS
jgi:hypothetical protein